MSKRHINSKAVIFVLMLAMLFAGTSVSFATGAGDYLTGSAIPPTTDADCSTYVMTTPSAATSAAVTLVIEAANSQDDWFDYDSACRLEFPVTMSSNAAVLFSVSDVVAKADEDRSDIEFYGKQGNTYPAFTSDMDFLAKVTHGGYDWVSQLGFDGWAVRINDKYPVIATAGGVSYAGITIKEMYVEDGDVIHFFYDFPSDFAPSTGSVAADYVRSVVDSYTAGALTVQMQGHNTNIDPSSYVMSINEYEDLGSGIAVSLYNSAGALLTSGTTDSNGSVTFSGTFSLGQSYIIKSTSTDYICPDEDYADYLDHYFFDLTGAYSVITLQ